MRARSWLRLVSILTLTTALNGCGDDDVPSVPTRDGGTRDAGERDGGGGGGDEDAGGRDGGTSPDGSTPDGSTPDGGGSTDGGGISPSRCMVDPDQDLLTLATDSNTRVRVVAVAAGPTGHAVAWLARAEDGFDQVFHVEVPETGSTTLATQVTTGFDRVLDPVIASDAPGWTLAWASNAEGTFDVYAQRWEDLRASGAAVALTSRAGRDDAPALLPIAGGTLAAWVEEREGGARVAVTRALGAGAAPSDAQRDASPAGASVTAPELALRQGGYSLLYVDSTSPSPDVQLVRLDASRAPLGPPIAISTEGNADGTLDVAADERGGAVVFGVSVGGSRPEVRARLIDGTGMPTGEERVITAAPESGRDASIARLAGGYVVAYRALEETPAQLRLAFVSATLEPIGTLDVAPVEPTGGRATVRVSNEGRLVVGWADVGASETTIRAARVRCD